MNIFESLKLLVNSLIDNIYEREIMMNKKSIYFE